MVSLLSGDGFGQAPELHVEDTLVCGGGLCKREIVELVVREGPERVQELVDLLKIGMLNDLKMIIATKEG